MSSPDKNKLFGLIGAAGFVAPRHMEAIQFNGQKLVASLDPSDNVGCWTATSQKPIFSLNSNASIGIWINAEGLDQASTSSAYVPQTTCTTAIYVSACALVHTLSVRNHWS